LLSTPAALDHSFDSREYSFRLELTAQSQSQLDEIYVELGLRGDLVRGVTHAMSPDDLLDVLVKFFQQRIEVKELFH